MARLTGQEITVRAWEARLGREGVWCRDCRRTTPTALLAVQGQRAALCCESCRRVLAHGESWLARVAERVPVQLRSAVEVADR